MFGVLRPHPGHCRVVCRAPPEAASFHSVTGGRAPFEAQEVPDGEA